MALQSNLELKVSHLTDQNLIQACDIVSKYPPFLNYSFRLMLVKLFDQLQNKANVTALINNKIVAYAGWVTVNDSDAEKWFNEGGELPLPNWVSGNSGVRAYPSSEGSGSEGFIFNAEIRKELPRNFTFSGFYDFGYAKQYVDNATTLGTSITTGNTKNEFNLKGYGLALSWSGPFRSNFSGMWARRIGNNPNPQATGTDSDGSHPGNFYWLQANINF
jgi:hypothetical protein